MARKTKQQAQETRQHILDVALRLFSRQGVSSTSLAEIAKAAGVTRGAIYWHFKNKSDLFSEIWELSESNIGELEIEYQAKFPDDPLSVLREILVHLLEATVTEERRRLLMEIIFHKCEFVGEMAVVQQAQRSICVESYDRIDADGRNVYAAGGYSGASAGLAGRASGRRSAGADWRAVFCLAGKEAWMKAFILLITLLLLSITALLSLRLGVVPLPWSALIDGWHTGHEHHYVLTQYRLPRLLLAIFVGAALAISGVLVQGIVRNPLASPDILGVNHEIGRAHV